MKTRKIILLTACAALLCVCVAQMILTGRSPVRTVTLQETPDSIRIQTGDSEVLLAADGGQWYTGERRYPANQSDADSMLSNLSEIKILDAVGKAGGGAAEERYELQDGKALVITAQKDGRTLRTVRLGKTSSTGAQSYITLDGGKDIYLVSGNLHSVFGKSEDALRSKKVYGIEAGDILSVLAGSGGRTWGLEKTDDSGEWKPTGDASALALDSEKADAWVSRLANLSVSEWLDDGESDGAHEAASVTIRTKDRIITVDVSTVPDGEDVRYICGCSETPYRFEISSYTAEKYMQAPEDLKE